MPMEYDLELEKAVSAIKKENAKTVCIQLPDGLKPMAGEIKKELEKKTGATIVSWLGSCFGACDVPLQAESLGVDLIIQFGHSPWKG
jgi:2-(3-amino-3-carboxypropyl)histidine synthase